MTRPHPVPDDALLARYRGGGGHADCFVTELPLVVSQAAYVEAFYTTWLFKLERAILRWAVARPSTDDEARALATGRRDSFAAWRVEARAPNELLMCDLYGRTRSWLKASPAVERGQAVTRLYFGSAVVPRVDAATGQKRMGLMFRALLGFHTLYSHALLRAARGRLLARVKPPAS